MKNAIIQLPIGSIKQMTKGYKEMQFLYKDRLYWLSLDTCKISYGVEHDYIEVSKEIYKRIINIEVESEPIEFDMIYRVYVYQV